MGIKIGTEEYNELKEVDMLLQLVQEYLSFLGEMCNTNTEHILEDISDVVAQAKFKIGKIM